LSQSGSTSYTSTSENRLNGVSTGALLFYDPLGRLQQSGIGGVYTRFDQLGSQLLTELDTSNVVQRRYVYGPGTDEPLVWYEGNGTTNRRWLHADERGSIIAVSDGTGAMLAINRYYEYGIPAASNVGRFGYTGQAWLPEIGMNYYKARMYSPTLGRFMQSDPIGYGDGLNLYAYVGGDPVNFTDPLGWSARANDPPSSGAKPSRTNGTELPGEIVVTAAKPHDPPNRFNDPASCQAGCTQAPDIIVNGTRPVSGGATRPPPPPPPPKPKPTAPKSGRPEYCRTQSYGLGKLLSDAGDVVTKAGLAGAVVGAATGVGAAGGLAVATSGGVIQTGGAALRLFGGDPNAPADLVLSLAGGRIARTFVPGHLRNQLADGLSGLGFEGAANFTRGEDPCNP
jgi:RHS repeat-associated protein